MKYHHYLNLQITYSVNLDERTSYQNQTTPSSHLGVGTHLHLQPCLDKWKEEGQEFKARWKVGGGREEEQKEQKAEAGIMIPFPYAHTV